MRIEYNNKNIEKVCTNVTFAQKKYGERMAEIIHTRIRQIIASDSVQQMVQFNIGRCHLLKGNRKNQYSLDLVHPYRLIFEKRGEEIIIARIMEIVDYH